MEGSTTAGHHTLPSCWQTWSCAVVCNDDKWVPAVAESTHRKGGAARKVRSSAGQAKDYAWKHP